MPSRPTLSSVLIALAIGFASLSCSNEEAADANSAETDLSHDYFADELIRILGEVTGALESATDAKSATFGAARLHKLTDETLRLMERMKEFGLPIGADKMIITRKVSSYQEKIDARLEAALSKALSNPETSAHIKPAWDDMVKASQRYQDVAQGYGMK